MKNNLLNIVNIQNLFSWKWKKAMILQIYPRAQKLGFEMSWLLINFQ